MNKNNRYIGRNIADKYLGHEDNIAMDVRDARYRYYQWLREWYGFGQKEATNKCPFYQFMFWGSLLMLVSIVPIIVMKIIEVFILKPLSWIIPTRIDKIYGKFIDKSKMVASWVITVFLVTGVLLLSSLFYSSALAWVGLVIHFIFVIPVGFLVVIWTALVWLFTVAIPWVFVGLVWLFSVVFSAIGSFFLMLAAVNWAGLGFGLLLLVGILVGSGLLGIILYKIGVWLFSCNLTKWAIKKSCKIRERQIEKKRKNKERRQQIKHAEIEAKFKWEEEHADEIEEQRILEADLREKRKESTANWLEFIDKILTVTGKILLVFPGSLFIGLWHVIRYIGIGFWIIIKGIGWCLQKVVDVFTIVWSLIFETISNHCPPIDFIFEIDDVGLLNPYKDNYVFECDNEKNDIIIEKNQFPEGFKLSIAKKGKRGRIKCLLCTRDVEKAMRLKQNYNYYDSLEHPSPVYEVVELKYDRPKSKVKVF